MPTAFISYSHDNEVHSTRTLTLANQLRQDGVDISIDAYQQHPPEGWPKWMERQFRLDFLIIVLSPRYITEFNQDLPSHSGARYEGAMVSALLSERGVRFDRIAIVCFDGWAELVIPLVLTACPRYNADQPKEYQKLYAFLTGQTLVAKPPLGKIVTLSPVSPVISASREQTFSTLCKAMWPLMEDNRRIFEDFGPNSGAGKSDELNRVVRFDTLLWKRQRLLIDRNNRAIAEWIRVNIGLIPDCHVVVFRRLLSHIEAFAHHLADEDVDYRDHQFPREVIDIVKGEL